MDRSKENRIIVPAFDQQVAGLGDTKRAHLDPKGQLLYNGRREPKSTLEEVEAAMDNVRKLLVNSPNDNGLETQLQKLEIRYNLLKQG